MGRVVHHLVYLCNLVSTNVTTLPMEPITNVTTYVTVPTQTPEEIPILEA
jgi:hypothetical protein